MENQNLQENIRKFSKEFKDYRNDISIAENRKETITAEYQKTIAEINKEISEKEENLQNLTTPYITALLDEVDKGLADMVAFLKENEETFDYVDLKLHDVSMAVYKNAEEYQKKYPHVFREDSFYDFCDIQFDIEREFYEESHPESSPLMENITHIGRTSSFYTHDRSVMNNIETDRYRRMDMIQTVTNFIYDYDYMNHFQDYIIEKDGKVIVNREAFERDAENSHDNYACLIEDSLEDITEIANGEVLSDMKEKCADGIAKWHFIKDFKDNQVQIFEDYLANEEENNPMDLDEEEEAERE